MSSERSCILDTVVLLYFLLAGQDGLLRRLIGDPMSVPVAVYDPEERSLPQEALRRSELLSEMRQAIRHYEVLARSEPASAKLLDRLRQVDWLYDHGHLQVIALMDDERVLAARLQSHQAVADHSIRVPLGPGEAACVAIAFQRGWTIATDDAAAFTVLGELHGGRTYGYERIRKLLIRATDEKLITPAEAERIHAEMKQLGFWDAGTLFP